MVKNYLPSIPITVPGSTRGTTQDSSDQDALTNANRRKTMFSKKRMKKKYPTISKCSFRSS